MTKWERAYIITLIVLAFLYFLAAGEFALLLIHPITEPNPAVTFVFSFTLFCLAVYLAAMLAILVIFFRWREPGAIVLAALNIVLMLSIPLGTALGIMYFWKVRKKAPQIIGDGTETGHPGSVSFLTFLLQFRGQ